jgi:hypothetical protein
MAIFRGIGGAGDSTTDATVTAVTEQAVNASNSATAAASSASAAAASASAAATSATNAASSEAGVAADAAAATAASTAAAASETAALASETAAAASESAALASETAAAASESAAATSASNAASSASSASSSASTATTKASEASASASAASTSASNAATSASNAASSASSAASSASSASASADAALAALDNFDDRYLGQKASDPSVDNDGNALVAGALYFNTTDNVMKVYEGSSWVAAYASLSGALLAANNLSDVSSVSSARTNLGLGTGDSPSLTGLTLSGGTANGVAYLNGSKVLTTGSALTFDGTNLGVGTSSPSQQLSLYSPEASVLVANSSTATNSTSSIQFSNGSTVEAKAGIFFEDLLSNNRGNLHFATNSSSLGAPVSVSDARMTVTHDGNVGIGTSSPAYKLDVAGSADVARFDTTSLGGVLFSRANLVGNNSTHYKIQFVNSDSTVAEIKTTNRTGGTASTGTGYELSFATAGTGYQTWFTNSTERMRLTSAGNVGIGTGSPAAKLESVQGTSGAGGWFMAGQFSAANYPMVRFAATTPNKYSSIGNDADGGLHFLVNGHSGAVGTTAAIFTPSGNVGIGTSSPTQRLDVSMLNSGASGTVAVFRNAGTSTVNTAARIVLTSRSGDEIRGSYIEAINVGGANYPFDLVFGTSSSNATPNEKMRLNSAGTLGLGVTPSEWGIANSSVLQIKNTAIAGRGNDLYLYANTYISGSQNRYIASDFASLYYQDQGNHVWSMAPSGTAGNTISFTQRMTLTAAGNLGIGTSSPGANIEVLGNSAAVKINESGGGDLRLSVTGSTARINAFSNHPLLFSTNNTERMAITSAGNVGIGTTSPDTRLTVLKNSNADFSSQAALRASSLQTFSNSSVTTAVVFNGTTGNSDKFISVDNAGGTQFFSLGYQNGATRRNVIQFDQNNTIYLSTAGTERMRITSAGNVGIGTSSPNSSNKLQVTGDIGLTWATDQFIGMKFDSGTSYKMGLMLKDTTRECKVWSQSSDSDDKITFYTGSTPSERLRITSAGNVGIGTNSPVSTAKTSIKQAAGGGAGSTQLHLEQSNTTDGYDLKCDSADGALAFLRYASGSATERMRITSGGNLQLGTTTGGYRLNVTSNGGTTVNIRRDTNTGGLVDFNYGATGVGSISTNGTTTAYNTSSDYRLKEDIAPMTGALAKVAALKPCTYKWKVDGSDGQGFIAHELDEVVPGCVTGEKDAVDADGNPKYQGIDTSFLVATLTAAIQEQQAIIESLTARVSALEGN